MHHMVMDGSTVISPSNKMYIRHLFNDDIIKFGCGTYYLSFCNDPMAWKIEVYLKGNIMKKVTIEEARKLDKYRLAYWANLHKLPKLFPSVWGWAADEEACPLPAATPAGDKDVAFVHMKKLAEGNIFKIENDKCKICGQKGTDLPPYEGYTFTCVCKLLHTTKREMMMISWDSDDEDEEIEIEPSPKLKRFKPTSDGFKKMESNFKFKKGAVTPMRKKTRLTAFVTFHMCWIT